ncbi:MAG: signal peptidase I [Candidatus Sericytochromatia bacterium]|nr:signal peptidase I [Candidatus Sericytochromatia bacterium]
MPWGVDQAPRRVPAVAPPGEERARVRECIWLFLAGALLGYGCRAWLVDVRLVPTPSMRPTLEVGDRLVIDKFTPRWGGLAHGDIVVFAAPPEAHLAGEMVKRVVALPGERLALRQGRLWVDDRPVLLAASSGELPGQEPDWNALGMPGGTVPLDHLFVMGDDPRNSTDSRVFGPVPQARVTGLARVGVWPWHRVRLLH